MRQKLMVIVTLLPFAVAQLPHIARADAPDQNQDDNKRCTGKTDEERAKLKCPFLPEGGGAAGPGAAHGWSTGTWVAVGLGVAAVAGAAAALGGGGHNATHATSPTSTTP